MPAKVVSFINLKGGVAKTTTAVGTALALAEHFGKKVLVVDLDPQTSATVMLIGEENWIRLDDQELTLYSLFSDAVDESNTFSLSRSIQKDVGNLTDVSGVDLLPSSIQLVYLQDEIYNVSYSANDPNRVLEYALGPVLYKYDYVLIDCPPNLGVITLNGLQISDGYVIPCIPDILSTYGISQILNRIGVFAANRSLKISPLGIVFTKVKGNVSLHKRRREEVAATADCPVFQTVFYEYSRYAEAAEYNEPMTFRQKWGGQKGLGPYYQFCQELIDKLEQVV